ncbi:hypothetical protein MUP77_16570 [Candidatus Bathyarchaeota archaeon]|nr:hypothetical protein [Candidatus Bathyarchaeota archaeon]
MPRLSPEELHAARIAKKKEREVAAKRRQEEEEAMISKRQQQREEAERQKARLEQLVSASDALYDEMDKLTKKAPAMTISQLSLERVNKIIRAVKEFLVQEKDDFVEELVEFVPAGDMPEYRDVTLVLSQIKAGLDRFGEKISKILARPGNLLILCLSLKRLGLVLLKPRSIS